MTAKDEILGRIRSALREAPAPAPIERAYRRGAEHADLAALFAERVGEYRANVRRTDAPRAAVEAALADHGARRVVVPPGLEWRPDGVELIEDRDLSPAELDALDGVITGCAVAIAETGTIALSAAQGRRAITLVPDLHVCVVEERRIVATVPEAVERLGPPDGPVTLIAGPSATSDIELDRVEGVHGPRRLEVIVTSR